MSHKKRPGSALDKIAFRIRLMCVVVLSLVGACILDYIALLQTGESHFLIFLVFSASISGFLIFVLDPLWDYYFK